jgi:hypothetical protein
LVEQHEAKKEQQEALQQAGRLTGCTLAVQGISGASTNLKGNAHDAALSSHRT